MTTSSNKFEPTHNMTAIGQLDVPVVILSKTRTIWRVADEDGRQFWVGKFNLEEV